MLLMPLVGFLVSRVDPRYLIGFGFALLSLSLLYMTAHLYPGMDFKTATLLRVYQSAALAFLFVPINTLVYSGVPLEKNNAVSGIVNLSRNLGGDVGIAFLTTFIARRSQKHQVDLSAHTTPYYPQFHAKLLGLAEAARHAGTAAADAMQAATATMYRQVLSQATTLAYIDTLKVLAIGVAMMLPLLLFTRRPKAGALASGH
jgi:DHA2 family multidrug resistance protein